MLPQTAHREQQNIVQEELQLEAVLGEKVMVDLQVEMNEPVIFTHLATSLAHQHIDSQSDACILLSN